MGRNMAPEKHVSKINIIEFLGDFLQVEDLSPWVENLLTLWKLKARAVLAASMRKYCLARTRSFLGNIRNPVNTVRCDIW